MAAASATNDAALNKALKPHLKEIENQCINLNREEAKCNLKIMEDTLTALVAAMKESNPLFSTLCQRPVYTGSYYEGLRIRSANEFDLNIIIHLPFAPSDVEVAIVSNSPEYVTYRIKRSVEEIFCRHPKWEGPDHYKKLSDFFDSQGYLLRHKVHRWVQGVISTAINTGKFQKPKGVDKIVPSQSGPAFTYYIHTKNGRQIDVDLVPAIDGCPYETIFKHLTKSKRLTQILAAPSSHSWFMVPKPPKINTGANTERNWRTAFPELEKKLLDKTGCLKLLIKLFKLLRDCENWKPIASYYIKTMFLIEFDKDPVPDKWSELYLGTLFMKMLRVFQKAVSDRKIVYYFHRGANLLNHLSAATASNYSDRLNTIISGIEKDPSTVRVYISSSRIRS